MTRAIADLLRNYGVYSGSTTVRDGKALALSIAGVTEDDVRVVAEHLERTADDPVKLPRYLGGVVNDPQRFVAMAADVRHANAEREKRAAARGPQPRGAKEVQHMPNMPLGTPSCDCTGCVEFRASGRVTLRRVE